MIKWFKSHSQHAQDLWVLGALNHKRNGTFLDLGCWEPQDGNNTYNLRTHYDWRGLSVDRDITLAPLWANDPYFRCVDALTITDWPALLNVYRLPSTLDYLSLDLDDDQLMFVRAFPWSRIRFRVLTVEHDSYRLGPVPRDEIRSILYSHNYGLAQADITHNGQPYEDWWFAL